MTDIFVIDDVFNESVNDRDDLDGRKVRTLCDILDDDGNILVLEGETFTWSESEDHQFICGEYIWVDPNEVEIIGDMP